MASSFLFIQKRFQKEIQPIPAYMIWHTWYYDMIWQILNKCFSFHLQSKHSYLYSSISQEAEFSFNITFKQCIHLCPGLSCGWSGCLEEDLATPLLLHDPTVDSLTQGRVNQISVNSVVSARPSCWSSFTMGTSPPYEALKGSFHKPPLHIVPHEP